MSRCLNQPASVRLWSVLAALSLALLLLPACGGDQPSAETGAQASESAQPASPAEGAAPASAPATGKEAVVATVDGRPILQKDLDLMQTSIESQNPTASGEQDPEAVLQVLESLITRQVAVNSATDGGYSPSDAEVEEAIDQISGRAGGREGFDLSLAQFGMSIDDLKRQVSETMAITSWRDTAFLAEAKVSDEEARGFYEANIEQAKHEDQVRALQIMIPIPMIGGEQDDTAIRADAKARAEDLLKRAQDGEDFEELIQQGMDQATSAAIDNGRLGWVTKGMTGFPELEEVIFALKPGEVGGLVESPYSYHIVKVLETRPAGTFSFEEIKPEIVEILTNTKIDMKVREALMNLRRAAKVEILSPELAKAWPAFQDKLQAEMAASEAAAEAMDQAADSPAAGEPAPPASEAAPAAGEPTPAASEAAPAASEAAPAAGEPAAPAATEPAAPAATEPAPASSEAPAGQ